VYRVCKASERSTQGLVGSFVVAEACAKWSVEGERRRISEGFSSGISSTVGAKGVVRPALDERRMKRVFGSASLRSGESAAVLRGMRERSGEAKRSWLSLFRSGLAWW